ncbi:MAG: helix-turn-helix domain-containing protein, partial [Myxococcota bacterium]
MTERPRTLVDLPGGTVDLRTGVGARGTRRFELTDTEVNLLTYLVQRPEQVVDKAELLTAVWHFHPRASSRAVDTAVRRLRSKLGDGEDDTPAQIRTTRSVGYSFHPIRAGSRRRPPRRMFGREVLLTRIRTGLEHGPVWLFGLRGVGKTAAAAAIAGESRRRVAWVDAAGRASDDELFVAIARVLQLQDAASVRLALERWIEPLLIVLDDVDARAVNDWAVFEAMSSAIDLLITSVEPPDGSKPLVLPVPPLELEPAVALLRARGGLPPEDGDQAALLEVVTLVGALPLGIEVAGAMLARTAPVALVASLRSAVPERLQHVLSAAIDQVSARARWVVIHLAVFEGRTFPFELAAEVSAPDGGSAELDELVSASLVEWVGDASRLRVLRPVAACTAGEWASSPDRERVRRRHRDVLAERAVAWSAPSVPATELVCPGD